MGTRAEEEDCGGGSCGLLLVIKLVTLRCILTVCPLNHPLWSLLLLILLILNSRYLRR